MSYGLIIIVSAWACGRINYLEAVKICLDISMASHHSGEALGGSYFHLDSFRYLWKIVKRVGCDFECL
jgi:hypothetical protein